MSTRIGHREISIPETKRDLHLKKSFPLSLSFEEKSLIPALPVRLRTGFPPSGKEAERVVSAPNRPSGTPMFR